MLNGEIAPSKDDVYAGDWVHFVDETAVPKALMGYFQGRGKTIDGMGTGCTMFNQDRRKQLLILVSYGFYAIDCPRISEGSEPLSRCRSRNRIFRMLSVKIPTV